MITLDIISEMQNVIMPPNEKYFDIMDMGRVPGTSKSNPYYILHASNGLLLVDIKNKRIYTLSPSEQENFASVCRSICMMQIDQDDAEKGFWLAQIDNSDECDPVVKCFDFSADFVANLDKQAERITASMK